MQASTVRRIERAFRADQATGMTCTYQLHWGGEATCYLELRDGCLRVAAGQHPAPTLIMYYPDEATALALLEGRRHPTKAFMADQVRSSGHLIYALQLNALFGSDCPS